MGIMEQLRLRVPSEIKAQIKALNEVRKYQGNDETISATARYALRLGLSLGLRIANNGHDGESSNVGTSLSLSSS